MTYKIDVLNARVRRARSAKGKGIKYKLGKGGFSPAAPRPDGSPASIPVGAKGLTAWAYSYLCDCSGFIAWVCELRRDQVNAGKPWSRLLPWIETTMVYRDATGPQRVFVKIPKPIPGCLVVYGDRENSQGHIGVVTHVKGTGFDVVDCSSGMSRSTGDAIHERDGAFFVRSKAIFCVLKQDVLS